MLGMNPPGSLLEFLEYCKKGILGDMAWVVGFLNEDVKASLDVLPLDIRASF